MLQLSFLLYIFPILVLVLGAIIGENWGKSTGVGDPSAPAAIIGFIGFFSAIGTILLLEKTARRSDRYKPVIIRIKKSGGGVPENGSCNACR